MIDKEAKKLIEENAVAFSTVNKEGNPHCSVVAFVKVISKDEILITCNYMVSSIENIQRNPNVCLTVWNKDWQKNCVGYSLIGKAKYFTSGKYFEMIKKIPENQNEPCKGAILVKVEKIKKLG